ncbi:LmeA family phospholipid-binding protein [Gordonia aichiensis]|uniref:DUF2993 domain-containing protein n=1 Tax=Gordonia aichiensis NBRC 108223 TaxID=1220583 RepID=L7KGR9_9ACTN|nr:DUF2993 domain-containing protein [Gordonia aichiensis]GAC48065.1 hypothetical protein GOACH_04_04630 [Gordonia aichiensis NBRC 108223]
MSRSAVNKAADGDGDAATGHHRHGTLRARRTLIVGACAVVVLLVGAFLADLAVAARGEYRLSRSLQVSPKITYDPEVTLGGVPYVVHASRDEFSGATITARGVAVAGCAIRGGCTAELGARLGTLRVPDGWNIGPSDVMATESVDAYTRLDSVNLGRFLGILDLTVNTPAPEDKAGGGGPQDGLLHRSSGVLLTGTVAVPPSTHPVPSTGSQTTPVPADTPSASEYRGRKAKVSVSVDLTVHDGRLHLQATGFYDGPEEHETSSELDGPGNAGLRTEVLHRFSTTLPPLPLPWGLTPTGAHSEGSDILLVADTGPRELRPRDF